MHRDELLRFLDIQSWGIYKQQHAFMYVAFRMFGKVSLFIRSCII